MPASTLIFAPHANSYDRFVPGAHAPTGLAWAYENRTAAIRIPAGNPAARRIEHRVAGGDINPYLLLAAVLGAALTGIEDAADPPDRRSPAMPMSWTCRSMPDRLGRAPSTASEESPLMAAHLSARDLIAQPT